MDNEKSIFCEYFKIDIKYLLFLYNVINSYQNFKNILIKIMEKNSVNHETNKRLTYTLEFPRYSKMLIHQNYL